MISKTKYKVKVKEWCIKCVTIISIYKGKQGKVIPLLCVGCAKKIKWMNKEVLKPHYWISTNKEDIKGGYFKQKGEK